MNRIKRILVLGLVLAMLINCFSGIAIAAEKPTLTIDTVTVSAGESIEVPVRIANNTGICGAMIAFSYDSNLIVTNIEQGDALSTLAMTKPGNLNANPFKVVWDGMDEDSSNGIIATITVTAPSAPGTYTISAIAEEVLDGDLMDIDVAINDGAVVVASAEEPHVHDYELTGWNWTGYTSATATFTCKNDETHVETVDATITSSTTEATCTEDGSVVYTATVTFDGKTYTDQKTQTLEAVGHEWNTPTYSWASDNSTVTATQTCKRDSDHFITEIVHTTAEVVTEPTCTENGETIYTATFKDEAFTTQTKTVSVDALGHTWSDEWSCNGTNHWHVCTVCGEKTDVEAHTSSGAATADKSETCTVCGYVITPPLGHTHGNQLTLVEAKAATCTETGNKAYYVCDCGIWFEDAEATVEISDHSSVVIAATGHTSEVIPGTPATCTETGLTEGSKCAVCGEILTVQTEISALGHSFTDYVYNDDARMNEDGTETAVCDRDGCQETHTRTAEGTALPEPYFTDLEEGAYYVPAVAWAIAHGITNGTSETTFSPESICTRGQVVTFLWRAAGKPTAKSSDNPFTDLVEGKYYYEAVLWAVENGITNGITKTTFGPETYCTRAQVATFLWRASGKPEPISSDNPFVDVAEGAYYYKAVLWAVENGITNGTSATTFRPDNECTRAQIVTFLYRAYAK